MSSYSNYKKIYEQAKKKAEKYDIDFEQYFSTFPTPHKAKPLKDRDINTLARDLELFTKPGGEDIVKYRGQFVPKAYKELYKKSVRRFNDQVKFREQTHMKKFEAPDESFAPFGEYAEKIIRRASPLYRHERYEQYKTNYLSALKDSLYDFPGGAELYEQVSKIPAKKLIDTYYTLGNEDLGIANIYPGNDEQAVLTIQHLKDRWSAILS